MQTRMSPGPLTPAPRRAPSPDLPSPVGARTSPPARRQAAASPPMQAPAAANAPAPWRPQPSPSPKPDAPAAHALGDLSLAIGKGGAERTFEELRRAIMSAQQEGRQILQLAIGGPLARWLAHGPASAPPTCWHLLLLLPPERLEAEGAQLLQGVHKRLLKRGFGVPHRSADSLTLADGAGRPAAIVQICPQQRPQLTGALACDQLVYTLKDKTWHAGGGLDVQTARHYGSLGLYRVPTLTLPHAQGEPLPLQPALEALTASWRHQQAGLSPGQPLDFGDMLALLAVVDQVAEANPGKVPNAATVRLVHQALVPELCPPDSELGRQQLGLAAVALCQLGQFLAHMPGEPADHPLYGAVRSLLRSQCPDDGGLTLAVLEAVSGPPAPSAMLRLFLQHSRGSLPDTPAATVRGATTPMLRIALPALRTHLFVPDAPPEKLGPLPGALTAEAIAAAALEAGPVHDSLATLLGCPALRTPLGAEALTCPSLRRAWAEALGAAATAHNPQLTSLCRARLVTAMALMHPPSVHGLPPQARTAVPLDALRAALLATPAPTASGAPQGPRSGAYGALFGAHLADGKGPEALHNLDGKLQAALIGALAEAGALDLALGALPLGDDAWEHVPAALTLQLLQAALAHQHAGAARLLDAMAACPAPSRELLAHPQLFAQACATAAHLEPLACVLAGSGRCPPAAWAAWLQAVSQRQQTAALATFVDRANPIHDGYRPALEKLTELLRRNPGAPGGPMAEAGWRRLYDRACQAGEEASQEALALLTLEAPQRGLGRTVFTFTDAEAYDLCCRVLFNVEDQPSVTLALTRLRHLDDPDMTMEGFVFCLQTVAPTMLHQGWGEGWHAYLGAMLTEIQPHIGDLDRTVAGNLVELASLGFTTDGIALNQACEVAALTVHLVLGHHCPELAFTLLQHGTAKPEAQHPLMHHLLHAPGIGLMNRNWLSVVKTMAQKVSPRVQQLAPDPAHVPLHQISFWAQWTERLIEARLHPDLYEALGPQTTVTNLQDCLGLLRVRHVFVPLRSDEPLLTELSLRLQDPRLHELALTYLRDLNQLCRRLPGTIGGPASEPPPAPLWHAVLRGQALYRDDATLARQLLGEVAGVCFEGQPAVVHERTPLRGITFATELADVLLGDAQYDHQGRRALIESLACRDLHEPEALQRLHILHQRATTAGHDKDDAPVFMAVKALVADGRRVGAMTPLQRTQYELAAAYLAHALCISHDELPASLRAQAIIELLDNLGPVSSNLWSALTYILSDEESLLTATSEDGARCLAQFRQRNALGTQAPVAGQLDATIGQTIVLSHLNLALARLGAPHLSVVSLGVAVHHFMDMHVLFDHSQTLTMFQDFQRALTLLCRQERLNSGMLEALVVRLLDPSYERLSGRFIDYLFEALLGAAPINACHLGIYMAVSQQLQTSATHSSRRGARIKDMLRQSNKQMVQGATALSRTLSRCALEAQQQPERVEQLSHEALRVYVDLWPHGWPSPACEPI